jgi:hypothetical protein
MTPKPTSGSVFFDHWQACLRAHFVYVLRIGDHITEPTLRDVLLQTGQSEADLAALYDDARRLGPLDSSAVPDVEDADDEAAFSAEYEEAIGAAAVEPPAALPAAEDDDYAEEDDYGPVDTSGQMSMF